jgi:hypothetical protein
LKEELGQNKTIAKNCGPLPIYSLYSHRLAADIKKEKK